MRLYSQGDMFRNLAFAWSETGWQSQRFTSYLKITCRLFNDNTKLWRRRLLISTNICRHFMILRKSAIMSQNFEFVHEYQQQQSLQGWNKAWSLSPMIWHYTIKFQIWLHRRSQRTRISNSISVIQEKLRSRKPICCSSTHYTTQALWKKNLQDHEIRRGNILRFMTLWRSGRKAKQRNKVWCSQ